MHLSSVTNLSVKIQVDDDLKNQDDPEQRRAEKINKNEEMCLFLEEYNSLLWVWLSGL